MKVRGEPMKAHRLALFPLLVAASALAAPPGFTPKPAAPAPTPQQPAWNIWVSMFRDYIDLIDHFARVNQDTSSAGVAAVIYADDILRTRPPQEAIDYYLKLLPEVKDPIIVRAIRLRLADHYRLSNQADQALGQLRILITASPVPAT